MPGRLNANTRGIPWSLLAPAAFLFLLPIAHTTPARIACLVLSVLTVAASYRQRLPLTRPPSFLVAAIIGWICVCLGASFASIEPAYSWGEFRNEVLSPIAAFGVFYVATDTERRLRRWSAVQLASFGVVATIAATGYLTGVDWGRAGFVGDRNAYSTYIVLIVPFLIFRWCDTVVPSPRWRMGVSVAILLALVTGAFTQNRNMWFAIAFEFVLFTVLVLRRLPRSDRRRLGRRALVAGIAGIVIFVGALAYVVQQKAVISHTSTEEQARFDRDPRFEIWVYAAERIRERPWFGHGYGRGILRSDFRAHFGNPLKWHGHNLVVDYVLEAGIVGGVAIVLLFVSLLARSVALYRSGQHEIWLAGVWMITMIAGITLKVMTDDILVRENSLLFWSAIGMTFGLASRTSAAPAVILPSTPVMATTSSDKTALRRAMSPLAGDDSLNAS